MRAAKVELTCPTSTSVAVPQPDEGVTYAAKIDKAETRIDFSASNLKHLQ